MLPPLWATALPMLLPSGAAGQSSAAPPAAAIIAASALALSMGNYYLQKSLNSGAVQIRGLLIHYRGAWVCVGHGGEGPGGQVEGCRLPTCVAFDPPGAQHNNRSLGVPAQLRWRASTTFALRWRTTSAPRRSAHRRTNLRALLPAEKKGGRALP